MDAELADLIEPLNGFGVQISPDGTRIAVFPQSNFSGSLEILPLCCGLLLGRTGLWLTSEALEQSARAGMSLGSCLFEFGGCVCSTGAAAVLTDA